MAEWLLIRLPREPHTAAAWLVCDGAGRVVAPQQHGPLAQAAALGAARRVCAIVPSEDVLITAVEVPLKSGMKVQQIVPYALEEQLAEDIESLHFAVGKHPLPGGRTPVAVVTRSLMSEWLGALRAAGLSADALYAASDLIPANPGQAVALLEQDSAVVRPAGGLPLTLPLSALGEALELISPAPGEMTAPADRSGSGLVLYTGAAEWHQCSQEVEARRERFDGIKVQLLAEGSLALLAQRVPAAALEAINLLQGPYGETSSLAGSWKAWRLAAALLGALIVLHAAGGAAELYSLQRSERTLDAAIDDTFRAAMPGEHNAIDARRRMERRLAAVRAGAESEGLLAALGALAHAHFGADGTQLQALNFRDGSVDLTIAAPNAEVLDRLSQNLRAAGWQADLTSGTAAGQRYEGHIQIRPRA
ncbi:MAG TPA: type II secretion system protein GspL [Steroidobacteraceae bacterium]|nr:type II secretion system protein GspL [Steroidobacteraceae bacterium]